MKIIASVVVTVSLIAAVPAAANPWRHKECRYQGFDHAAGWSPLEVKKTILCGVHKFGVDKSTALYIANRESRYMQYATSWTGACGIYQHLPKFWGGRISSFLGAKPGFEPAGTSCYDARSNVLVALWMAQSSWSPWSVG